MKKGQVIAIDGKNLRGAKSHGKKSPVHHSLDNYHLHTKRFWNCHHFFQ